MKSNIVTIVFYMLVLCTCCTEEKKNQTPESLVPPDRMVAFLRDIHKTEASLLLSGIRQDSAATLYKVLEKEIYSKHKLDSTKVRRSLKYYAENIEMLDSLYIMLGRPPDSASLKLSK